MTKLQRLAAEFVASHIGVSLVGHEVQAALVQLLEEVADDEWRRCIREVRKYAKELKERGSTITGGTVMFAANHLKKRKRKR